MIEQDTLEVTGQMSKSKIKVLVWLPFPPRTKWRGEGIAQTIENIISHGTGLIEYHILCNKQIYPTVHEIFEKSPNNDSIKVKKIGLSWPNFLNKRKNKIFTLSDIEKQRFPQELITGKKNVVTRFFWACGLFLQILLLKISGGFSKYNLLWLPSPLTLFAGMLDSKKVVISFWDPFVFEYSGFSSIAHFLFYFIAKYLLKAKKIITQSRANESYLTKVLGIDKSKIKIIRNGAPTYTKYLPTLKQQASDEEILHDIMSKSEQHELNDLIMHYINLSTLFRLLNKKKQNTKIIIVSTQYRPYKGFETLFLLLDNILKKYSDQYDFQFIFTTANIPQHLKSKYPWSEEKIHAITQTSEYFHASLYYLSNLALHPSNAEGGLGSYPQYEAASLNVPCLNHEGRHMDELAAYFEKDISPIISDFSKIEETGIKIVKLLKDDDKKIENIALINETRVSWENTSLEYEKIFLETANAR